MFGMYMCHLQLRMSGRHQYSGGFRGGGGGGMQNEDLFFTMLQLKCVLSIFIYNIALQNTDFGVL